MIVCCRCNSIMMTTKIGIYVIETYHPDETEQAYKIWNADLLSCPTCGNMCASGFGRMPLAQVHQDGFERALEMVLTSGNQVVYARLR